MMVAEKTGSAVATASGDLNRADESTFDPMDNVILAINNADTPPFGTFITVNPSTCALTQPTAPAPGVPAPDRILFNTANGADAQGGAEQPQWDPVSQRFYVSIPQIGSNVANGGVVRIDPTTHGQRPCRTLAEDAGRTHEVPQLHKGESVVSS